MTPEGKGRQRHRWLTGDPQSTTAGTRRTQLQTKPEPIIQIISLLQTSVITELQVSLLDLELRSWALRMLLSLKWTKTSSLHNDTCLIKKAQRFCVHYKVLYCRIIILVWCLHKSRDALKTCKWKTDGY